jgi:hypothetical protein
MRYYLTPVGMANNEKINGREMKVGKAYGMVSIVQILCTHV